MNSRFFAATNTPKSPSASRDGAERLKLHGDSGPQLAPWNSAFPLNDFEPKDLTIPPELEVPLAAIVSGRTSFHPSFCSAGASTLPSVAQGKRP